ncbi:MAG: hypothetical protein ACREMP_07705 [Candidatus Tyrphobacter sp.]
MLADCAICERFTRTSKYGKGYVREYGSVGESRYSIGYLIDVVCNPKRLHPAPSHIPPVTLNRSVDQRDPWTIGRVRGGLRRTVHGTHPSLTGRRGMGRITKEV